MHFINFKTDTVLDAVVIGAGPGGIACSYFLSKKHFKNILVLESGYHHRERRCMVDYGKYCVNCGITCDVISGFGGCLNYGDGVKLSFMPCARKLIDLFGYEEAYSKSNNIKVLFENILHKRIKVSGNEVPNDVIKIFNSYGMNIREYPVATLSESELKNILNYFYHNIEEDNNINLLIESSVRSITREGSIFKLDFYNQREKTTVRTKNVIFATGRKGGMWAYKQLRDIGIKFTPPRPSYGVRFVMKSSILNKIGSIHPDLKISYRFSESEKVKTFCFCGGENGGSIKFVNYQNAFEIPIISLDGHKTSERTSNDKELAGTFGLLAQCNESVNGGLSWIYNTFIPKYRDIADGKPLVQTLRNFINKTNNDVSWDKLKSRLDFELNINDLKCGPLFDIFDTNSHNHICTFFEKLMTAIYRINNDNVVLEDILDQVLVVGPELEFFWPKVEIDKHCRTSLEGCFVIGDATGHAQGIIPAMMMGLAVSEGIVPNEVANQEDAPGQKSAQ